MIIVIMPSGILNKGDTHSSCFVFKYQIPTDLTPVLKLLHWHAGKSKICVSIVAVNENGIWIIWIRLVTDIMTKWRKSSIPYTCFTGHSVFGCSCTKFHRLLKIPSPNHRNVTCGKFLSHCCKAVWSGNLVYNLCFPIYRIVPASFYAVCFVTVKYILKAKLFAHWKHFSFIMS